MENKRVMEIVTGYFKAITDNDEETEKLVQSLATIVQDKSTKLVHFGDTVFLSMVRDKNLVEFQPIYDEEAEIKSLIKDLDNFVNFLKVVEVNTAYTYGDKDFPYSEIIEKSKFNFKRKEIKGQAAYYLKV